MPINEKIITTLTDDEKDVLEVFPAEDQIFFDLASRQSFQVYNLGIQVLQDKMINDQLQNMPEEHKKILSENTDIPSNLN
jgi:hypothetical protein